MLIKLCLDIMVKVFFSLCLLIIYLVVFLCRFEYACEWSWFITLINSDVVIPNFFLMELVFVCAMKQRFSPL